MEINAEIKPLEGKYYGTILSIECEDSKGIYDSEMKIWGGDDGVPSARELLANWENSIVCWRKTCDTNHYESQATYDAVVKIKERIEK